MFSLAPSPLHSYFVYLSVDVRETPQVHMYKPLRCWSLLRLR